ncbi:MAG: hypothetical protein ACK6DR_18285 [Gemmatimonas sp.]|jgi:hypothetical protein|uniref:hypothetical protein n=1 Tax=Gemmatimonas sp. TaxID=1962908 RepID=UPI0025C492A6|nr:hypothetical protein [Gemmatimonas sp.]MCE2952683.1 hypothetical protein [Gemmatimonas sp.]
MRFPFRAACLVAAAFPFLLLVVPALAAQPRGERGARSGAPESGASATAGAGATVLPDSLLQSSLRVFLDCQGGVRGCDRQFFVQEMGFVNWVRDRFDSDVHLLLTSLNAGNGGRQITVNFLGQKGYTGKMDTLVVSTLPNDADDVVRRELLRTFQLGLAPYVARTPIASRLRLTLANGFVAPTINPRAVKDRWNLWLYRVDGNVNASGEQLVRTTNLSSTLSAARTTDKWKINVGATGSYNERDFKVFQTNRTNPALRDTVSVVVLQRAANANALFGRTINAHWTAGVKIAGGFSEVLNQKLSVRVSPAIEYNYFPWSEATRRQLTALYYVGPNYYQYYGRTVFDQVEETRFNHTLLLALTQRQKWGNTNLTLEGSQYLHDPNRNHVTLSGFVDLRLGRGFSLNFRGSASRVRDQIYIAANAQSERDILTQRQQLQTNFRYNMNVGIGYTFGSIYNTVVNQRFGNLGELGRRFGSFGN